MMASSGPATALLHLAGFTNADLATSLGVSRSLVSNIMNGHGADPPAQNVWFYYHLQQLTDAATAAKIIAAIPAATDRKGK